MKEGNWRSTYIPQGLRRTDHLMEANLDLTPLLQGSSGFGIEKSTVGTGVSLRQSCLSYDIVKNRLGLGSHCTTLHEGSAADDLDTLATVHRIKFTSQGSRVGNRRW